MFLSRYSAWEHTRDQGSSLTLDSLWPVSVCHRVLTFFYSVFSSFLFLFSSIAPFLSRVWNEPYLSFTDGELSNSPLGSILYSYISPSVFRWQGRMRKPSVSNQILQGFLNEGEWWVIWQPVWLRGWTFGGKNLSLCGNHSCPRTVPDLWWSLNKCLW